VYWIVGVMIHITVNILILAKGLGIKTAIKHFVTIFLIAVAINVIPLCG